MTHILFPTMNSSGSNGSTLNGATSHPELAWKQQSVHQFFSQVNWEDQPPEVQKFQQASEDGLIGSLLLTVNQFFSTVNWEGVPAQPQEHLPLGNLNLNNPLNSASKADLFTLDEFSDLF
ncbi:hypothetical protein [Leptolyngbya ohadii]|uniref:hypothetical protein n=1 Tax=Leptolyngbya ohadii TaxID=1962290 RepID=UPI000B59E30A|nr:hypothetical protein [Leptolyngbya ohadii]